MISFDIEPLAKCWHEIYDAPDGLAYLHWCETQQYRHYQEYAPSQKRYEDAERIGMFYQATARIDGKLVGYSGFYVTTSMHTQDWIAMEDTWYLVPEQRKGWNAISFYKYIEAFCASKGVIEITLTIPDTKDKRLGDLLTRLAYQPVSVSYSKRILAKEEEKQVSFQDENNQRKKLSHR